MTTIPVTQKKIRPHNKCVVTCTDTNQRVKGVVMQKTDSELVIELPTGFVMNLQKPDVTRKIYVCQIGVWEFISDGWIQS
jgi:hypothetical protein